MASLQRGHSLNFPFASHSVSQCLVSPEISITLESGGGGGGGGGRREREEETENSYTYHLEEGGGERGYNNDKVYVKELVYVLVCSESRRAASDSL